MTVSQMFIRRQQCCSVIVRTNNDYQNRFRTTTIGNNSCCRLLQSQHQRQLLNSNNNDYLKASTICRMFGNDRSYSTTTTTTTNNGIGSIATSWLPDNNNKQQQQQQSQSHMMLTSWYKINNDSTTNRWYNRNDDNNNNNMTNLSLQSRCRNFSSSSSSSDAAIKEETKNDDDTSNRKVKKTRKKLSKKQLIANALEKEYREIYHKDTTVYIKLCYTDHDIQEGDIVKAKFHYKTIVAIVEEEFGTSSENGTLLEYYNPKKEEWMKFVPYRIYEVLRYYTCTSKQPLPIRIVSLYDEEYGTRNDPVKLRKITPDMRKRQKDMILSGPSQHQWLLKDVIEAIIKKLKNDGYRPATTPISLSLQQPQLSFQFHNTDGSVEQIIQNTRDYVLDLAKQCPWTLPSIEEEQQMELERIEQINAANAAANPGSTNPIIPKDRPGTKSNPLGIHNAHQMEPDYNTVVKKVKHVLLSQPRALSHIVECIHYDFLWE